MQQDETVTMHDGCRYIRVKFTTTMSASTKDVLLPIIETSLDGQNWTKSNGEIKLSYDTRTTGEHNFGIRYIPSKQTYEQICDMFYTVNQRYPSFFEVMRTTKEQHITIVDEYESENFTWAW